MLTLHQFAFSHFNEKARWALDYKQLPHHRETYLPGPHMPAIRRLSGQSQTPVLDLDGRIIHGSAAIIDALENYAPLPSLYPEDARHRDEALVLQHRFDESAGPAIRTVVFVALIDDADYLCRMFSSSKSRIKQWAYRATFPLARPLIAKGNGVDDPTNVARCQRVTEEILTEVANRTSETGYLVGDSFSVADLAAASLIAPLADVQHPDMKRPTPFGEAYASLLARYAQHPAIEWVSRMYALHRP